VRAIKEGVELIEHKLHRDATVGVGIPGTISRLTHAVKNANSVWMIGSRLTATWATRYIARCAARMTPTAWLFSEATDGAGAGKHVVFAVVLGDRLRRWHCRGWPRAEWTQRRGRGMGSYRTSLDARRRIPGTCLLLRPFVAASRRGFPAPGWKDDYERATKTRLKGKEIIARCEAGEAAAEASLERYEDRLTRSLSQIVNILDPDVIVLGGGVSQVPRLYRNVPQRLKEYVFGREADTPVLVARHGDASGVRGAAWLWPLETR